MPLRWKNMTPEQKDHARQKHKEWLEAHPEKPGEYAARFRGKNRQKYNDYLKKWRTENPEKWKEAQKRYRDKKRRNDLSIA